MEFSVAGLERASQGRVLTPHSTTTWRALVRKERFCAKSETEKKKCRSVCVCVAQAIYLPRAPELLSFSFCQSFHLSAPVILNIFICPSLALFSLSSRRPWTRPAVNAPARKDLTSFSFGPPAPMCLVAAYGWTRGTLHSRLCSALESTPRTGRPAHCVSIILSAAV